MPADPTRTRSRATARERLEARRAAEAAALAQAQRRRRTVIGGVAAAGTEAFLAFHDLLFANQPAEGGAGLSDDELIALAERAGATGQDVDSGIRDRAYEDWTRQITDAASRAGLAGTPTVLIDDEELDLRQASPQGLEAAVRAAAAG